MMRFVLKCRGLLVVSFLCAGVNSVIANYEAIPFFRHRVVVGF